MNVLLVGSGGREHALGWKLSQSHALGRLYAAPGNPGIAEHAERVGLDIANHAAVLAFCETRAVGLVVIGPEAPLVGGLGDALRAGGLLVFGPDAAAARLEGSKAFTKDLCTRANIPTAAYARCADMDEVGRALARFSPPWVIKADGLAAGKGVIITSDETDALEAATSAMSGDDPVVVEEFLDGEEVSLFVLTDGVSARVLGSAQDHKRVGDGDTGPNTGGMGAYSPAPVLTSELEARAMAEIVEPTLQAMAAAGTPFSGVLYAGLMLTADGPKLIEYNVRFGDPEAQVLMMRLEDDLLELMLATARGQLAGHAAVSMSRNFALGVVVAAHGYPGVPRAGGTIEGIAEAEATGAKLFHAGTGLDGARLVANGGRVLTACALGDGIAAARDAAYAAVGQLRYPDGFWRSDIGWREATRAGHPPK